MIVRTYYHRKDARKAERACRELDLSYRLERICREDYAGPEQQSQQAWTTVYRLTIPDHGGLPEEE